MIIVPAVTHAMHVANIPHEQAKQEAIYHICLKYMVKQTHVFLIVFVHHVSCNLFLLAWKKNPTFSMKNNYNFLTCCHYCTCSRGKQIGYCAR